MDLEKLAAIGLQLGFSGAELNKWIEAQQAKLRDERAAEREAAKEADERQREILQLKVRPRPRRDTRTSRVDSSASARRPVQESWRQVPEPVLVPLVVESWRRVPEPALAPLFQEGWRGFPRRTTGAQGHNSLPPEHVSRRLQFVDSGAEPLEFDAATLRLPTSSLQVTTPPNIDFATECCRQGINDGPGYYPDDLNCPTVDWGATTTEQAGTQIRLVEGVPVAGFCEDWAVRAALRHEPRDDEVYVVAYPKSGTTWVHYLTRRLLHQGHESPAESAMQCMLSSIIGYTGSDKPGAVIKSHLLFGRTPFSEKARYVYVLRNPYDCCVSYYHQRAGLPNLPAISFDEFLDDFIEGQVPFGDYFDHLAAWFPERSRPNVICVPYEQLKGDVRAGILRIADFLGRDIGHALRNDDGALQGIIQTTSPDEMRRHFSEARAALLTAPSDEKQAQVAAAFRARGHRAPPAGAGDGEKANLYKLVRKATVGDCRNHFSDAQAQRMKANMDSKMASKMAVHREAVLVLWKSVNLP
ncbi:hypothetical protein HPB51_027839 [Rhipicephalus microplus]|uniref:Sulfotransferase domain-containing protein n=1 Tax=Rhipicephalus microplus TaxID=6941 RepID=A0A9J6CZD0_RHIMP|nr:hypothetical protein HPB51_027839 [Rhipicephalus microplus]